MRLSSAFKKAVAAVALASAVITPAAYTALRHERANNRYATCLAQNLGGKAGTVSITDLEGRSRIIMPVYRPYGLQKIGVRAGIIARTEHGKDDLALVLEKGHDGTMHGHWDFVRIAGKPIPTGTWGKGTAVPDAGQVAAGAFAIHCANNSWVRGSPSSLVL